MKRQKGFTLIELLVVIAIIALLSGVILASLSVARAKSRDARRISDAEQIRTAIALYANSTGSVPASTTAYYCAFSGETRCGAFAGNFSGTPMAFGWTGTNSLESQLSGYIPKLPTDPTNSYPYVYYYMPNGFTQCDGVVGTGTPVVIFSTEANTYNLPVYDPNGWAGAKARYCVAVQ
jgi:prepilin-type N-terminal cleavage/methylation domain-containing protein